jgi:hypothetical protein
MIIFHQETGVHFIPNCSFHFCFPSQSQVRGHITHDANKLDIDLKSCTSNPFRPCYTPSPPPTLATSTPAATAPLKKTKRVSLLVTMQPHDEAPLTPRTQSSCNAMQPHTSRHTNFKLQLWPPCIPSWHGMAAQRHKRMRTFSKCPLLPRQQQLGHTLPPSQ